MPSTFTTNKQFEKQATGENENTWGVQLNALFDDIDLALGYGAKSVAGSSDTTLTADEAKPLALEFTGVLTGNKNVIFPATAALYVIYNNTSGSFTLTAKTASGTGVLLPQGGRCFVYCDATNITTAHTALTTSFELAGVVAPSQIAANQNDYAPTGHATANVLRINSDAARDITGLAGGRLGRTLLLTNTGSFAITLKDESASSTAANRFALTADMVLQPDQVALLWYDTTTSRWRSLFSAPGVDTATATTWTASFTVGAAFSMSGDVSPSQITANQNDYNPTNLSTASVLRLNSDAARSITGLQGGGDGRTMLILNVGSFDITLVDESASSTAAYRFALPNGDIVLPADGVASFIYDNTSSRWRLVSASAAGVEIGSIVDYGGGTVPAGYILAYGQNLSRTTYARLFARYGTTHGSGDGSTTFGVPDLRGRSIIGKDDMGGSAANRVTNAVSGITATTLGAVGGDQNMHGHLHTVGIAASGLAVGAGAGSAATSGSTNTSTTGSGASQNMPPVLVVNKMIYAGV